MIEGCGGNAVVPEKPKVENEPILNGTKGVWGGNC